MVVSVRTKFTIGFVGIVLILGVAVVLFISISYSQKLTAGLQEKGYSIARDLSVRSVDDILIDDIISLHKLINDIKYVEEDICYAYILSQSEEIIVHTFENGFPQDLLKVNPLLPNQPLSTKLLETEKGFIRDIAVPIMDGNLGSLHLGISENRIRKTVAKSIWTLIAITCTLLAFGIIAMQVLVNRVVKPIEEITKASQAIGEGKLDTAVKVNSKDEVGELARNFNLMASKLKKANNDLANAQEQLIQSRKLASIGHFASGIAHEINNPLAGILNCTRRLLASPAVKGEERHYLELVLKGLVRIENIIKQLLTFSRRHRFEPQLTDVHTLIQEALAFLEHRLREQNIQVENKFSQSLPLIMAEPFQLQQVFMNIIKNALDAMPTGGVLNITTGKRDGGIFIEISDNGYGIKKEHLGRIFDPFFTTKEVGRGVGLGLSVSYGVIQQHHGTIDVRSNEGEGTTVSIILPVNEESNEREKDLNR